MESMEILEKAYNLFLISEIIESESELDKELERLLIERNNEIMAKTLIYVLIYTVNNDSTYRNVRNIYINEALNLLYMIDRVGFNDGKIIRKFVQLMYNFFSYMVKYKIKFITDSQKRELVKAKLNELVNIV